MAKVEFEDLIWETKRFRNAMSEVAVVVESIMPKVDELADDYWKRCIELANEKFIRVSQLSRITNDVEDVRRILNAFESVDAILDSLISKTERIQKRINDKDDKLFGGAGNGSNTE